MSKKRKRRKVPEIDPQTHDRLDEIEGNLEKEPEIEPIQNAPLSGCLTRLFWMLIGNAILLITLVQIFQSEKFGTLDIIYWLTVIIILAVRYIDIRYLDGKTIDDQPATISHWYRYAVDLIALCLALWGGSYVIKYTIL